MLLFSIRYSGDKTDGVVNDGEELLSVGAVNDEDRSDGGVWVFDLMATAARRNVRAAYRDNVEPAAEMIETLAQT